ncbi:hypothetical protein ACFVSQ_29805 [Streptomyces niveus]|uniref:hypothetical protein n=1 Tax=Streptomyces niveus TaxID=193462 RepID=UPI0036E3B2B1
MTAIQPVEARCDHCKQTRPLFLYEPGCGLHLGANAFTCPWCSIEKQPLLCVRCWGSRKEREDNDPELIAEYETWQQICAANRRAIEREEVCAAADKTACDGIAAATEEATA